jgi:decaprenyl-phosphate phosphoribosyltransferase
MSKVLPPRAHERLPAGGVLRGLIRTARPKQWAKNVLVFAAPGAAGVLGHESAIWRSLATFAAFCLLSAGTYMGNDAFDADSDRHHPRKRFRPVAAGIVPRRLAFAAAGALVAVALAASAAIAWRLLVVGAAYVAVQIAYSLRLKHEPVFDLAAVATGFVLRAIAGGVATHVPISEWFLIVAMFGSLMMVTGKRFAEHQQLGERRGQHRATLDAYSEAFLRTLMGTSVAIAITAYCLWAFERQHSAGHHGAGIWFELSIAPFVIAIFRYAFMVETGHGGQPEEVILSDRALQLTGAVWIVLFALGVY